MKKYILFLFLILTVSCKYIEPEQGNQPPAVTSEKPPVIIVIPDPDATTDNFSPEFAVKISDKLYFSDRETMKLFKTGVIHKAGEYVFSVDDKLYTIGKSGNELEEQLLQGIPVAVKKVNSDIYYCVEYSKEKSYSLGGTPHIHTEILKNNSVISDWYLNEWKAENITTASGEVFVLANKGGYKNISGGAVIPDLVLDGSFHRSGLDTKNKTIFFNSNQENYEMNYVFTARNWINYNGKNYSELGDTWSEPEGFIENITAMSEFRSWPYPITLSIGESPVLLALGERNGELYWIECNTGYLVKLDVKNNVLTCEYRLYFGNGTHETGIGKHESLKAGIFGDSIYFTDSGNIYELELSSGLVSIFYAGNGEILKLN